MSGSPIDATCQVCTRVFQTRARNAIRCPAIECQRERTRSSRARERLLDINADNQRVRDWRSKNRRSILLVSARQRAKRKKIPCTLTLADIPVPTHCPVLGLRLEFGVGHHCDASPSLDRIRADEGYVPGNIAIVSWRANRLKSDATIAELEAVVAYMKKHTK